MYAKQKLVKENFVFSDCLQIIYFATKLKLFSQLGYFDWKILYFCAKRFKRFTFNKEKKSGNEY